MRGTRVLLVAVVVMAVMILLGTAVVIATVVQRAAHRPRPDADAPAISAPMLSLEQPTGTRIVAVTRQSDTRLAVTLSGGGTADRLLVWDTVSRRIVASLRLTR